MFLLFLVIERINLVGTWSETSPAQESEEFFYQLHPELLTKVRPTLELNENVTIEQMLQLLAFSVDKKILSLLNVTLNMKYFNPSALSRIQKEHNENEINRKNVTLRGWGAIENRQRIDISKDFQLKMLQISTTKNSFEEKISSLAMLAEDTHKYWDLISKQQPVQHREYYTFYPSKKPFSSVNGRVTRMDPHEILEAIIQEYKTSNVLKDLNITNRQFLTQKPSKTLHHYTDILPEAPILENYDIGKNRPNWAKTLKISKDFNSFLKYKENLVEIQIFIRVGSKMARPLVEFAENEANNGRPFKFHIFLFGNMSDPTEAKWVTCFWKMCDNVGIRSGIIFLHQALNIGLKRAYKMSQCDLKWRKVNTLLKDEWIMKRAKRCEAFCNEKGITDWAVSINGEFMKEDFPVESLLERALLEAKRIQDAMNDGLNPDKVSFPDWFKSDSILINGTRPPIDIKPEHRITLSNKRSSDIVNALIDLHTFDEDPKLEENKVPVFAIGTTIPELTINSSLYTLTYLNSTTGNIKSVFDDAKLIIGPFKFDKLEKDQIEYVIKYVNYSYHMNLAGLNPIQRHYIEMWRSDASFTNQKRKPRPQINEKGIIRSRQTPVTWNIITNPSSADIWPMLELMKLLANCELVGVDFVPAVEASFSDGAKSISTGCYKPAFLEDSVEVQDVRHSIISRSYQWEMQHQKGKWTVLGVIFEGFVSQKTPALVKIGDEVRKPFENGYFAAVLKPGYNKAEGFNVDHISVNSLVSRIESFEGGSVPASMPNSDSNVDLYTFCWNQQSFYRQMQMIYTFYANVSKTKLTREPRLFIIDPWISVLNQKITTVFLPLYFPSFALKPTSLLWYVKTAKYFYVGLMLPTDANNIIFADESVVFRGDASRMARVNWNGAAVAAPLSSSNNKGRQCENWDYKRLTMGRPFHNAALLCFRQSAWVEQSGAEKYLKLASIREKGRTTIGYGDDEYFNLLQLHVQCITLPEGTAFCSAINNKKLARTAIAHVRCEDKSEKLLGIRPQKLFDKSYEFFEEL